MADKNPFDLENLFLVEITEGSGKKRRVTGYAVTEKIAFLANLPESKSAKGIEGLTVEKGSMINPLLEFARGALDAGRKEGFTAVQLSNGQIKDGVIYGLGASGGPSK